MILDQVLLDLNLMRCCSALFGAQSRGMTGAPQWIYPALLYIHNTVLLVYYLSSIYMVPLWNTVKADVQENHQHALDMRLPSSWLLLDCIPRSCERRSVKPTVLIEYDTD